LTGYSSQFEVSQPAAGCLCETGGGVAPVELIKQTEAIVLVKGETIGESSRIEPLDHQESPFTSLVKVTLREFCYTGDQPGKPGAQEELEAAIIAGDAVSVFSFRNTLWKLFPLHFCMSRHWLKDLRNGKFPSQSALARAADVLPARLSRIEAGYCDITDEEARALAKALNVTVEQILTGKAAPLPEIEPAIVCAPKPVAEPPKTAPVVPLKPVAPVVHGDNLADAKNFTLLPPVELFPRVEAGDAGARAQLRQALVLAEKILHTPKVRPAVWVSWRDFSRFAQSVLRDPGVTPVATIPPPPKPTPVVSVSQQPVPPPAPVLMKLPENDSASRGRSNKNTLGHFLDVARETLPSPVFSSLSNSARLAREKHPEVGFMKHFKQAARVELNAGDFGRIDGEAAIRDEKGPGHRRAESGQHRAPLGVS
jgi:transcriptional regulator with XRE-family HTH domain